MECLTDARGIEQAALLVTGCHGLSGEAGAAVRAALRRSHVWGRLVQLLSEGEDQAAQHALHLVETLPAECLPEVCAALGRVGHRDRRRVACDLLMVHGEAAATAFLHVLGGSDSNYALDLVGALARSAAGSRMRRAMLDALAGALEHRSARVRFEAIKHVLARSPEEEAVSRALAALADSEAAVRRVAQEFLVNVAPAAAAAPLEKSVRDTQFRKRELGEQRRLLLAYGRSGGTPAVKSLIDILERRRKESDELREAAVEILAILRPRPARPVLERLSTSKREKAPLREAARRAVDAIDQAPATAPPGTGPRGLPVAPPATPLSAPARTLRPASASSVPVPVMGTPIQPPPAPSATDDDVAMVKEEPLWQDEPPARRAPPPEIAALLMEYLEKDEDAASRAPAREPTGQIAPLGSVKIKQVETPRKKNGDE